MTYKIVGSYESESKLILNSPTTHKYKLYTCLMT
jgi:hypothetical protein